MRLFNGKKVAEKILKNLKQKIRKENLKPKLAVILVGEDEASKIYIRLKKEAAGRVGVGFELYRYDNSIEEEEIIAKIKELNERADITGIIIQLPLPEGLNRDKIISAIDVLKDVDGFHTENRRLFEQGKPNFEPVLPNAILTAIKEAYHQPSCRTCFGISLPEILKQVENKFSASKQDDKKSKILQNKKAVALVNSDIFGQTLKLFLEMEEINFKYIIRNACLIKGAEKELKQADIVISVCGCPGLITGETIKKGAIVIDGGIFRSKDGKVVGDVERASVEGVASFLTPVPGGLGPLVIALLLNNVFIASKMKK